MGLLVCRPYSSTMSRPGMGLLPGAGRELGARSPEHSRPLSPTLPAPSLSPTPSVSHRRLFMVGPGVAGPVDPDPTSTHTQKGAFWKQLGELRSVVKDFVELRGSVLIPAAT